VETPEVTLSLGAAGEWARPGRPLPVAVRLQVAPGWYVYWRQPGEAGLPTLVEWALPPGWRAAPLRWPVPERYEVMGMVSHALRGDVVLLGAITPPADARGPQTLRATVRYGVCRDVCIPGSAELALTLPVRDAEPAPTAAWRALAAAAGPTLARPPEGLAVVALVDGARACLRVRGPAERLAPLRADSVLFFPDGSDALPGAVALAPAAGDGALTFALPAAPPTGTRLRGVLGGIEVDAGVVEGSCR
jgi:thiol:disulfide interchange protein DsbD